MINLGKMMNMGVNVQENEVWSISLRSTFPTEHVICTCKRLHVQTGGWREHVTAITCAGARPPSIWPDDFSDREGPSIWPDDFWAPLHRLEITSIWPDDFRWKLTQLGPMIFTYNDLLKIGDVHI